MAKNNPYKRAPGRASSALTTNRLWFADDHLLYVRCVFGVSETYKRFRYRDIQAVAIRPTVDRALATVAFSLLALLLSLAAIAVDLAGLHYFLVMLAAIFALLALIVYARGPTCTCTIYTAVQSERLRNIDRLRPAKKFLRAVQPYIDQAQGETTDDELRRQADEWLAADADDSAEPRRRTVAPAAAARPRQAERPLRHESGRAHRVLFISLLVDSVSTVISTVVQTSALTAFGALFLCWLVGWTIAALTKQRNSDLPPGARRTAIATLVYLVLATAAGMVVGLYYAIVSGGSRTALPAPLDSPPLLALSCVASTVALLLGIIGLKALGGRSSATAAATPPPRRSEARNGQ